MKTEHERARSFAYRLLALRRRTRRELEMRLEQKGFSKEVTRSVLGSLEKYGYINDKAFARLWVEQKLAKRGLPGLRRELMEKGVDIEIINEILAELDPEAEYSAALELAKKKSALDGGVCPFPRLAGFLQRRGFSYEVIARVCRILGDRQG